MSEVKRYEVTEMGPTYHKRTEMLLSDDGCWVDYEDYAALKAERDAMAAENAAMRDLIGATGFKSETPATEAYLNSVRADGVEDFANQLRAGTDGE